MSDKIVLYDLPSKDPCGCWSANTWKARLVLNYKKLPYTTKWIEFPSIEPTMKGLGLPENSEPKWSSYSVPVITLPTGEHISDSLKIAQKLEELHPTPSLRLDADLHVKADAAMTHVAGPLMPYFMPRLRRDVLTEESADWFKADREKRFGMPEDQWESEKGGDVAWAGAERGLKEYVSLLTENKRDAGPFILGSQVSYGDFVLVGMIDMFKRIGEDAFERFVGFDESIRALYEGCVPWLEPRD